MLQRYANVNANEKFQQISFASFAITGSFDLIAVTKRFTCKVLLLYIHGFFVDIMPSWRMCSKDESLSSCIKSRNPLGVIVLVLLFISGAFIYTAYYITSASSQKTTEKPISKVTIIHIIIYRVDYVCLSVR